MENPINGNQSPEANNNLSSNYQRPKSHKVIITIVILILFVIVFFGGVVTGVNQKISSIEQGENISNLGQVLNTDELPDYLTKDVNFKLFWKVWDIIRERYIDHDKITDAQLFYGAMQGTVASLGDPYSVFLPPDESKAFSDELSGKFEGIGAELVK